MLPVAICCTIAIALRCEWRKYGQCRCCLGFLRVADPVWAAHIQIWTANGETFTELPLLANGTPSNHP